MGLRDRFARKVAASVQTSTVRVDALGTVVSLDTTGRRVAMFLGVPPELSGSAGGTLLGGDAAASFYQQRAAQQLWDEVAEITSHDSAFDIRRFSEEATTAFLKVQRAFAAQDGGAARHVLATPLWEQARFQIEEYRRNGKRNVQENLQVQMVRLLGAHSRNGWDTVGLRLFTATVDYDIDEGTGRIIRGDKALHMLAVDALFERSSSAITVAGGGTMRDKCPNCGAPLSLDWDGSCRFCKSDVMGGAFDWVLSKIIQRSDWDESLASCPPDILAK